MSTQFDAAAATWNQHTGFFGPIAAVLAARTAPRLGETLLDVACGRGEPGLTLVESNPSSRLIGVDLSPIMIEGARADARGRGIVDARFVVGSAEDLPLDDHSVDLVVSRMGMLGVPDATVGSAREAHRVLTPGGRLAIVVWNRLEDQTALAAAVAACRAAGGAGGVDLGWMDRLADGRRERWLHEAGFVDVASEPLSWVIHLVDEDALWATTNAAPPLAAAFAAVDDAARTRAREHLIASAAPSRLADGSYAIPVSAQLLVATKPATRPPAVADG